MLSHAGGLPYQGHSFLAINNQRVPSIQESDSVAGRPCGAYMSGATIQRLADPMSLHSSEHASAVLAWFCLFSMLVYFPQREPNCWKGTYATLTRLCFHARSRDPKCYCVVLLFPCVELFLLALPVSELFILLLNLTRVTSSSMECCGKRKIDTLMLTVQHSAG